MLIQARVPVSIPEQYLSSLVSFQTIPVQKIAYESWKLTIRLQSCIVFTIERTGQVQNKFLSNS